MKNLKKLGLFAVAGTLVLSACNKKEFIDTTNETRTDNDTESYLSAVYNRTVNYTVVVASQKESSFRSENGVAGATVAVAVDGEVKTATTDASGQATFTGLKYGSATVTVSAGGHTTANFVVDFTQGVGNNVDNHSQRSASTLVKLLPTANLGTATLTGVLDSRRDDQAPANEFQVVPDDAGASLFARVSFQNYDGGNSGNSDLAANHGGAGRITDFYYEGLRAATTQALNNNSGRRFTMTLPATAYGLAIQVWAAPFTATFTDGAGDTFPNSKFRVSGGDANGVFSVFNGTAYTGETYIRNLRYTRFL